MKGDSIMLGEDIRQEEGTIETGGVTGSLQSLSKVMSSLFFLKRRIIP